MPLYNLTFDKDYYDSKEKIKVKKPQDNGPGGKEYEIFKDDAEYCENDEQKYYKGDVQYSEFLGEMIPKYNSVWVENMGTYISKDDSVLVITGFELDDWNATPYFNQPYKEWYHVDDPREPFFKYKGIYFLNNLKEKYPEYFDKKENDKNNENN